MRKLSKRRILILTIILIFVSSLGFIFHSIYKNSIKSNPEILTVNADVLSSQEKVNFGSPVRLKIPTIKVDTVVEYIGLATDGTMGVPKGPNNVAWYKLGPKPGEVGSAVLDGHSGWRNGIPAVFDNLHKISKGDKIYIEKNTGEVVTFVVTKILTYQLTDDTKDVFISNDGKAHLNLITCTGDWNEVTQNSTERLVVYSEIEI